MNTTSEEIKISLSDTNCFEKMSSYELFMRYCKVINVFYFTLYMLSYKLYDGQSLEITFDSKFLVFLGVSHGTVVKQMNIYMFNV